MRSSGHHRPYQPQKKVADIFPVWMSRKMMPIVIISSGPMIEILRLPRI